jgi:hypothetical protein
MVKGQMRGNKEKKKPKAEWNRKKKAGPAPSPFGAGITYKSAYSPQGKKSNRFGRRLLPSSPGMGSSISRCPSNRFRPFFAGAERFSSSRLRRSASMRLTTFCGGADGCSLVAGIPVCFFRSISTTAGLVMIDEL